MAQLVKYYPAHTELLKRTQSFLKDVLSIELEDNIRLAYQLQKKGCIVEIWSDNGLGGPKNKKYKDSDIGMIPELSANSPLYRKYPSVHIKYEFPTVYSRSIGVLKKNPEFFRIALSKHKGLSANDVLFIEDREQNLESAKSLGIHCLQFIHKTNIREKVLGVKQVHTSSALSKEINRYLCKKSK